MSNAQIAAAPPAVNSLKKTEALELLARLEQILTPRPARGARLRALNATLSQLREAIREAVS
jgi:hypothetical protein